jgi:hypothetical protein
MIRAGSIGAAFVVLVACSGNEVIVQAHNTDAQGQAVPLRGLPVRALPYDRDAIFDSLRRAYSEPEPQIPSDLMALRDSIVQYREEWRTAETRWGIMRDSLKKLSDQLQRLNRASGQYVVMFREFNALDPQVAALQRQSQQAFQRFTALQNRAASRQAEIRQQREQWADAAYADVDRVIEARLKELRLEERADTTDDNGIGSFRGLKKGDWWIHARYDLPNDELVWNVPLQVTGGRLQVQLTPQNAQVRPKL